MEKFLQKSCQWLVMLIAMFAVGMNASAQDATIVTSNGSTSNNGVTISGGYGFQSGYGYLCQPSSQVTISASQTITKIVLTENSNYRSYGSWSVAPGAITYTSSTRQTTWEGSAESVVFSNTSSSAWDYYGIDKIEVWFGGSSEPIVQPNFPVEGQAYQLKHNASGLYLNVVKDNDRGTVLGAEAQPLTFTWDATKGGFTIQNDVDLYVGSHSNDWNMSCSLAEYWTVEGTEGAYTLKRTGTAKYLNFNSTTAGSAAFRDKGTGAVFSIEPYVAPTVYSYRVNFTGYPDGEAPNLMYDGLYYGQDDVVRKTNDQLTESDIQVTNIAGYDYDVAISHPQAADAYGAINVAFAQRAVSYFTIPTVAFRKDIDVTYDSDWNEVPSSMYFRVLASDVPGLDSFKYTGNGKQITAQLTADGAEPRNAYLTIYGSYDGSQASVKSFDLALADKAFSVTFPKGAFEAANGDLSDAFTYSYDPEANRVTYTFYFYNSDTSASVPADLAVVYANNPNGDRYTTGSNYVALYAPSPADFTSLNPYWEIDPQRSNVSGTNINLYFNQQPYKYYVTIEGNENAVVTVKGQDYSNTEAVETYTLLTATDVTYNDYKGYTVGNTELTQPEDGKGGVIYVSYDAKTTTYASVDNDNTNPAPGSYSLDDRNYGFQYFNVYFEEAMSEDVSIAKADLANAGITLRDAEGRDIEFGDNGIKGFANGNYISFSTQEAILAPGTYTLHIPAGAIFFSENDMEILFNNDMDLEWTLTAAEHYTVQWDGLKTLGERMDPENERSSLKNLSGFEITAPEGVTFQSVADAKLYIAPERGGMMGEETNVDDLTEATGYSITLDATGKVLVSFDPVLAPAEPTSYSYIIPAGAIVAADGLTNKQISLSASVDPTVYFDLVVTYPAEGNAQEPVDHITVQLPEDVVVDNIDGYILFNGYQAEGYTFSQDGRELTINFGPEHAAMAGSYASYFLQGNVITGSVVTSTTAVRMANSTAQQYKIPVTAAPTEYLVEFEGWPFDTHGPQVTYNDEQYYGDMHILALDLSVDQLSATPVDGYNCVITIDEPGYVLSHGFGRVLVTYSAKEYAAVGSVSPAADSEISLDTNPDGLGSITITMDGEAGWDASVYAGDGNPVPEGVKLLDPNGEEVTINDSYGFCMWEGSTQININHTPYSLTTPGTYTLIIPAGLNTIGGKENPAMEYTWTVKAATTFEFDRDYTAIGAQQDGGWTMMSLRGFSIADSERNFADLTIDGSEVTLKALFVSADSEMGYPSEEDYEDLVCTLEYDDAQSLLTFNFPSEYTTKGRLYVNIPAGVLSNNQKKENKPFSLSFSIDPNMYFAFTNKYDREMYSFSNAIREYTLTSDDKLWLGEIQDLKLSDINGYVTFDYWTNEAGRVDEQVAVAGYDVDADDNLTIFFEHPVVVPFDTYFTLQFPEGFIRFDRDDVSYISRRTDLANHTITQSWEYRIVYDEQTVPEGCSFASNGVQIENGSSFGSISEVNDDFVAAKFTATPVTGLKPVFTIVQPTVSDEGEVIEGQIIFGYVDNRVVCETFPTYSGDLNNLGNLYNVKTVTVAAPEGRTFSAVDAKGFMVNADGDYLPYDGVTAQISTDGSSVTFTLDPAYATPGFFDFYLEDFALTLDDGAAFVGVNGNTFLQPANCFEIVRSDIDNATIYNGALDHIQLYMPEGYQSCGYNTELGIEFEGPEDWYENYSAQYIYGVNNEYMHIQFPADMYLPEGRIVVTIPAGMFFMGEEVNAPYRICIDNVSVAELASTPVSGSDIVGQLSEIRVMGAKGQRWSPNMSAASFEGHIYFNDWNGDIEFTTSLDNGVLVITPTEPLGEGYYTLSIDAQVGVVESADVAARPNASSVFSYRVVDPSFEFSYVQPSSGRTVEGTDALDYITFSLPWGVEGASIRELPANPTNDDYIQVAIAYDNKGVYKPITDAEIVVSEYGDIVFRIPTHISEFEAIANGESTTGIYNVAVTVPAGYVVLSNGRTSAAQQLEYTLDTNKYFSLDTNFESWSHVAGPVRTFTLTAPAGVTFTGIAPDTEVDRPTIFKGGSYLTYAVPAISADGKSVTLTLAEPISADSPYDQYYLVVPEGLFIGTVADEEGNTATATSRSIDAWQRAFYVDAPAYDHVEIAGPVENGESITSYGGYIYVYVNKTIGGDEGAPEGTTLTSADGQSVDINGMWSVWSSDCSYFVVNTASNLQPGTYTLHVPADSRYADGVIDFTFTLVETFDLADGTFAPTGTVEAQTLESFTWTAPEGKTIQSVDLTKIGNGAYDSNWNWVFTPLVGLTYEIAGENNQVVFTLAEPITVPEGQTTASLNLTFQGAAIVCADGSMSKGGSYSVTIDPYPNDINRDGKEDLDDVNAIVDIVLEKEGYQENKKADQNDDNAVTITDVVKYIQKLRETPVGPVDEKDIAL